ncbi:asparagine synthase-related protein [Mesobacillus foraminis]|uniref:asparagine synthase-related protein n=1 Tax=Mesobacillus foraminis TaxID=279826 RepID=UPI0039A2CAD4
MSAITGMLNLNNQPVFIDHTTSLMTSLERFPANDIQKWEKGPVFLGCHAQWITPESIGEQLPFYDPERGCCITADAIIDNREELCEKLGVERPERKLITDSQLILLSYYKWGNEVPKHLVGDFAFIIWDESNQTLFGARDFTGARTLYYYKDKERFVFATTIRPLLELPFINRNLNEQWLAEYLAIPDMFDSVSGSPTIYKGIHQIPPSHCISVRNHQLSLSKYEALLLGSELRFKSNDEYEEAFREIFKVAVDSKIRTHKQVGAQLSGGLDSGSVASFAANTLRKENKQLYTFSYIPPGDFKDFTPKHRLADETPYIKSIVNHVGNIKDSYLDFQGKSSLSELDDFLEMMEMPYKFHENSFWLKGTYEKASENGVGVLLNGAGGNFTISWGPAIDYYAILFKKLRWSHLLNEVTLHSKNTGVRRSKLISAIGKTAFPTIFLPRQSFQFPILINKTFAERTKVSNILKEHNMDMKGTSIMDPYKVRMDWFQEGYYLNPSGTAASKLSLRYGLWNRDPTNDLRVIRFCLSVPEDQFVQNGFNRALIRRSTKDYLPDKVRLNQGVRGIQAADWVHRLIPHWSSLISELKQVTENSVLSEFLNIDLIKSLITKFEVNPRSDYAFNPEFRVLMRSLTISRFIKTNFEGR